jgi:hypothetical protein
MKYKDIYLALVKPNTTWTVEEERDNVSVVSLSESKSSIIFGDQVEGTHKVMELEKFNAFDVPDEYDEFDLKNPNQENKSFLILVEDK